MDREFDWVSASLIVPQQYATTVYRNSDGDIVIRQDGGWDREEDDVVVLATQAAAEALIDRIRTLLSGLTADE